MSNLSPLRYLIPSIALQKLRNDLQGIVLT
jgi:hypothetical protein